MEVKPKKVPENPDQENSLQCVICEEFECDVTWVKYIKNEQGDPIPDDRLMWCKCCNTVKESS